MAPGVSQVNQVVYKRNYRMETLKHVFQQTMACILDSVNASGRSWQEGDLDT
jgi:hypothetical protein